MDNSCKCLEIIDARIDELKKEIISKTSHQEAMSEKDFYELQALLKIYKTIKDKYWFSGKYMILKTNCIIANFTNKKSINNFQTYDHSIIFNSRILCDTWNGNNLWSYVFSEIYRHGNLSFK